MFIEAKKVEIDVAAVRNDFTLNKCTLKSIYVLGLELCFKLLRNEAIRRQNVIPHRIFHQVSEL